MADSKKPAAAKEPAAAPGMPFPSESYLFLYNLASSVAWATVLMRTLLFASLRGTDEVYPAVKYLVMVTQTAACLEIVHSLTGIVRAPVFTTLMQVASRLLLVWGITFPFPQVASSPAYTSMLLAWSVTEVIRYSYFGAAYAGGGDPPSVLLWLRYNTFFILYPVGILSEVALIVMSLEPAAAVMEVLQWPLFAILAIYAPSAYVLYTHLMKQRVKAMKKSRAGKEKKSH